MAARRMRSLRISCFLFCLASVSFLFSALFFPDFAAEERFAVLFFPAAVLLFAVVFFLPDAKKSTSAS